MSGNVQINGLIIVYGTNNYVDIETTTGTPRLYGGFIMAGPAHSSFTMKGNGQYYYSSQTLNNIKKAPSLQAYSIVSWWE